SDLTFRCPGFQQDQTRSTVEAGTWTEVSAETFKFSSKQLTNRAPSGFFDNLDAYCEKHGLETKKTGVVVYCEESYQKYHKDRAEFDTRVLLQMGTFGKQFCLKRGAHEIGIKVEHGTVMFLKKELAGMGSKYYHGVPLRLNRGKITGSSILLIDLVKVKA
ncbi:hypothetical protein THAOC_30628, partial [Thalassiosira oceanica]